MITATRKTNPRPTRSKRDPRFAYTLAKGFQILESFTPDHRYLGNKDFWRLTDLNRSTISRLTRTLCDLGYLKASKETGKYELGLAVLSLAYPRLLTLPIRRIAQPMMQELANTVHGVVNLGMWDRRELVWIESCRQFEMVVRPEIGARRGFDTTIAQVFLAGLPDAERNKLLAQIKSQRVHDVGAIRTKVKYLAKELQANRFCYLDIPKLNAIVSTFKISPDGEMAIMDCVVEKSAMSKEKMLAEVAPVFIRMIGAIQETLGVRTQGYY